MTDKSKSFGVSLVQWNNAKLTISLLNSLIAVSKIDHIIITDNGSSKAELQKLKLYLSNLNKKLKNTTIKLLINQENSGFSAGMNCSIKELLLLKVDWIWVLNNDVYIDGSSTNTFLNTLSDTEPSIIGSKIEDTLHGLFSGAFKFNTWTSKFSAITSIKEYDNLRPSQKYIYGASFFVHRKVFQKVGLLNERTFLYFEELDFSRRSTESSINQKLTPLLTVGHIGSASSSGNEHCDLRMYNETWSTLDFYLHHEKIMFPFVYILRTLFRVLSLYRDGRRSLVKVVFKATLDFSLGRHKYFSEPKITERIHIINDENSN